MSSAPPPPDLAGAWAAYTPIAGVYDELKGPDGLIRPSWQACVNAFESLGAREVQNRRELGEREITKNGITYNPHDGGQGNTRPWALDPVPLVLGDEEWQKISAGMEQRALLYGLIYQDLFGPQKLIADRALPPDVLYGHPQYYPGYHGFHDQRANPLSLYAADLARSPDGRWWVSENRTQSPFGLGYVLENRVMSARLFPEAMQNTHIHRVAPFFAALRESLAGLAPRNRENPRTVLWSMGPASPAYFEDAYLARYLGYTLAEGADLAVRKGQVMLKTLGGLLPVQVLFRRLHDDDCDSVELNPASGYGVPGLLEVMRSGGVGLSNGLGSALLEAPLIRAFEDRLAKLLLGEALSLPSVATWWCGEPKSCSYVLDRLNHLVIADAYRGADSTTIRPEKLSQAEKESLVQRILAAPGNYVAQELVERSGTPVWSPTGPVAWRLALRCFAVKSGDGHCVLKGGLARVSPESLRLGATMVTGDRSQDVWISTPGEIESTSLLQPPGAAVELRRGGWDLPSRVCDNLCWLGRTIERIESTVRLHRLATRVSTSEYDYDAIGVFLSRALTGREAPSRVTSANDTVIARAELRARLESALTDGTKADSIPNLSAEALRLATTVRDRIAVEMWRSVQRIHQAGTSLTAGRGQVGNMRLGQLDNLLSEVSGFAGLTAESMTRADGWRFLDLGRRIERALQSSQLINATLVFQSKDEAMMLELLLEIADSIMTYRGRYMATLQPAPVLDLLITDETNPRSIGFQVARLTEHIEMLPRDRQAATRTINERICLSMQNTLRLADVYKLSEVNRSGARERLQRLLDKSSNQLVELSDAIFGHYLVHAGLPRHFGSV